MGVIEIALLTKTLYDVSTNRIALANRVRQYGYSGERPWEKKIKDYKRMEYDCSKELIQEIVDGGFGDMLKVKGIGPRTVGSIVMSIVKTERIYNKKGKYKHTVIHDELKEFPAVASLWHYAGYHVVCKNCGCVDSVCRSKGMISYKRGEKTYKFTGCGNYIASAAKKRRGKPMDWNDQFRIRMLAAASSLFRTGGPYRDVFLEEREKARERHPDWTKGRNFNHSKRLMIKQLLDDFYTSYLKGDQRNDV